MNDKDFVRVKVPISQIKKLRDDPKFILILKLGRYINQINFLTEAYLSLSKDEFETPNGVRYFHNSFFFMCGVLHEALGFYPSLGKEFKTFASYKNGFARLSKSPDKKFLDKNNVLGKMRNKFIFHVDSEPFAEALESYNVRLIKFIWARSHKLVDIYYNLSDELVLNYYIGDHGSAEAESEVQREIMTKVLAVMNEYVSCSNSLISEYVQRKLWKAENDS